MLYYEVLDLREKLRAVADPSAGVGLDIGADAIEEHSATLESWLWPSSAHPDGDPRALQRRGSQR
jgi:hypothetical protein